MTRDCIMYDRPDSGFTRKIISERSRRFVKKLRCLKRISPTSSGFLGCGTVNLQISVTRKTINENDGYMRIHLAKAEQVNMVFCQLATIKSTQIV